MHIGLHTSVNFRKCFQWKMHFFLGSYMSAMIKKTSNYLLSFMDVLTLACMKLDAFEKLVWLSFLIFIPSADRNYSLRA